MKRVYVKPQIACESFAFTENIALGCNNNGMGNLGEANMMNPGTCSFDMGGKKFFTSEGVSCVEIRPSDGIPGFCYNGPAGDQLFRS